MYKYDIIYNIKGVMLSKQSPKIMTKLYSRRPPELYYIVLRWKEKKMFLLGSRKHQTIRPHSESLHWPQIQKNENHQTTNV